LNPFDGQDEYVAPDGKYPFVLGIIKQFRNYHKHYMASCRDLGVSYKVIDITVSDWIAVIKNSQCDAYLVWPSNITTTLRSMFDERLKVMVDELGKVIYPSYNELWLLDNKRRVRDWLVANDLPHPRTWIFYDFESAKNFLSNAYFPIVFKTNHGYGATGVKILHRKSDALRVVKRSITRGIRIPVSHPSDRQWGNVLLQEYIPEAKEWRMVRIGDSYFGYEKLRLGEFHSGSGDFRHARPSSDLLYFVKYVCEKSNFTSMNVDVFVTEDGRLLVSELQTLFGMSHPIEQCIVNGTSGRMVYRREAGNWVFEKGSFCDNALCNLRVQYILDMLSKQKKRLTKNDKDVE